jgi:membrane protease YdiL (CAAX protease family)
MVSGVILWLGAIITLMSNNDYQGFLNQNYLINPSDYPWYLFFVFAVIAAPLLEEICFRLWLRIKYLWAAVLPIGFLAFTWPSIVTITLAALLVIGLIFRYKLLQKFADTHKVWVVIVSAIPLSVIHSVNFQSFGWPVFLVLVSILGVGLVLGTMRLKFGLWTSIVVHFIYNLALTASLLPPLQANKATAGTATKLY